MRNDFTNGAVNLPLKASLFEPDFDTNFTVVEPLRQ
jgi:hypothetical protein